MDDHEQREGKRESGLKQVAFHIGDISADSTAVAGGSIWARGATSQMVALCLGSPRRKVISSTAWEGKNGSNRMIGCDRWKSRL